MKPTISAHPKELSSPVSGYAKRREHQLTIKDSVLSKSRREKYPAPQAATLAAASGEDGGRAHG